MAAMKSDVLIVIQLFINIEFRCLQLLYLYMLYSTVVVSFLVGQQGVFADPRRPNITPTTDQLVPINSDVDVTYNCSTTNPGHTVFWAVKGYQITSTVLLSHVTELGISIQPNHTSSSTSSISISEMARRNVTELSILCLSLPPFNIFKLENPIESENVSVITYGAPMAPGNLRLGQEKNGSLILEWDRPTNMPDEVNIEYTITVRSMEESETSFETTFNTSALSHSFTLVNSTTCQLFLFTIRGRNSAGMGLVSTPIVDTVPISPDVGNISMGLSVDSVTLEPLAIDISFPHVGSCGVDLTLRNYTIEIDDEMALIMSYSEADSLAGQDNRIRLRLNRTHLPARVGLDSSHYLTVTVCHDVVCKTSTPQTFNTTDVQRVEAIFYENRLYLRCSFATNSVASGCLIKFLLKDSNETEDFEINREKGFSCSTTKNQFKAYSGFVVLDIEASGSKGNTSLPVFPMNVSTLDEYEQETGCKESAPSEPSVSMKVVIGSVVGSVAAAVAITIAVTMTIVLFVFRRHCSFIKTEKNKPKIAYDAGEEKIETDGTDGTDGTDLTVLHLDLTRHLNRVKGTKMVKVHFKGCCIVDNKDQSEITILLNNS